MSNIERKYAYYDEGVLPETGEKGVTYLTLYSSDAGNIYDGWIYDPENKIPVSVTERTFGYRRPESPQYCWDDEVVVDLSNAQNRQESSEFAQGRIASYNTNVSPLPIVLNDVDITGLTEEEREAKATTVLFTAIPLVKDAYIHADAEIALKMNASPDNQTGCIRIEAFYILNDTSDRTMRPHPINHYIVTEPNQYNLLPLLYFNAALRHDSSNYIGVKLLCTGGTAEIGISDNPEYGDAIIVLVSAGLTGDTIYEEEPLFLEISGLEEVNPGYKLDVDDYMVLCTYDSGAVYDVTRLCTFSPNMGTEITESETVLTATFQGLSASMLIEVSPIDHIELTGNTAIHGSYTLDLSDYTVMAHCQNGYSFEVTNNCTYWPPMGTVLTTRSSLTAWYTSGENTFTDSLNIDPVNVRQSEGVDIIYTLYNDNYATITGEVSDSWTVDSYSFTNVSGEFSRSPIYTAEITGHGINGATTTTTSSYRATEGGNVVGSRDSGSFYEIRFPSWFDRATKIEYKLIGKPLGITDSDFNLAAKSFTPELIGFENIDVSKVETMYNAFYKLRKGGSELSPTPTPDLSFLDDKTFVSLKDLRETFKAVDARSIRHLNVPIVENMYRTFTGTTIDDGSFLSDMASSNLKWTIETFYRLSGELDNIDFLDDWDFSKVQFADGMFLEATNIVDVSSLKNLDVSSLETCPQMFMSCAGIVSINDTIGHWNNGTLHNAQEMFRACGNLENINNNAHFFTNFGTSSQSEIKSIGAMFQSTHINSIGDVVIGNNIKTISNLFNGCRYLNSLIGAEQWSVGHLAGLTGVFNGTWYHAYNDLGISLADFFAPIANWQPTSCGQFANICGLPNVQNSSEAELLAVKNNVFANWPTYLPLSDGVRIDFQILPNGGYSNLVLMYRKYS